MQLMSSLLLLLLVVEMSPSLGLVLFLSADSSPPVRSDSAMAVIGSTVINS